jgi:aminoglycoside phosphotransferase (APT) family kinase protein
VTGERVPAHVLAPPPHRSLAWAAAQVGKGARVITATPIVASRWHANHVLTIERGGSLVRYILRRWARTGWDVDDPDFDARREATALTWLASTPVNAPELIAADPDAAVTDVPALLITILPGSPPPAELDDPHRFIGEMAHGLAGIHAVGAGPLPRYRPWRDLRSVRPPPWVPERWHRIWELVRAGAPPSEDRFIHRDYHHGNTLWSAGRQVGIVDWTTASIGPRGVDVAHARWNLAIDYGPETAAAFLDAYRALVPDYRHDPYRDAAQVADWLDAEPVVGTRLARLDHYLADVLG